VDGAVGAHGQARAERLLAAVRTERDRDHLALPALLLDPERLQVMPVVSIARPSPPIFTCVAVSGTCLIMTRIFMRKDLS
jgi:hypothetical protein